MIEVEKLTKYFDTKAAIKDVSFTVEKGEVVGLLGPNGAGKTTTMRILTCFFPPTSGKARVAGYDVLENPLEVRTQFGYFPEKAPLPPDMTVRSFLQMVAEIKGVKRKDQERKLEELMDRFAVSNVASKPIKKLSKGYCQRVCLAQAFINDPSILILDEPTIGLDPEQVIEVRNLIRSLAGEKTILLSTHILPEVSVTCQKVIVINEGKIVAADTPENLAIQLPGTSQILVTIDGPKNEVLKELREAQHVIEVEEKESSSTSIFSYSVKFEKSAPDTPRDIACRVHKKNWGLCEMRSVAMSLEEVFMKLITEEVVEE
jgi:ABC-2 type transport system ATP-binding protein